MRIKGVFIFDFFQTLVLQSFMLGFFDVRKEKQIVHECIKRKFISHFKGLSYYFLKFFF